MQTVIDYRMSRYGLSKERAMDQRAATELGRLWLSGSITEAMREAGEKYLALYEEMQRAVQSPAGLRKLGVGANGDVVSEEYVEWAVAAVAKWEVFKMRGWPVLQFVVIENQPIGDMLIELRVALNILAKKFGVEAWVREGTNG